MLQRPERRQPEKKFGVSGLLLVCLLSQLSQGFVADTLVVVGVDRGRLGAEYRDDLEETELLAVHVQLGQGGQVLLDLGHGVSDQFHAGQRGLVQSGDGLNVVGDGGEDCGEVNLLVDLCQAQYEQVGPRLS